MEAAESSLRDCVRGGPGSAARLTGPGQERLGVLLVLLGAEFGEPWRTGVTRAAVTAELVRLSWARPVPEPSAEWLLLRSAQLAAGLGTEALRFNARAAGRLAAAQLRTEAGPAPGEDPVAYLEATAADGAALAALALGLGATQAGAPDRYVRALTECGEHLGTALRIITRLRAAPRPVAASRPGTRTVADGRPGAPARSPLRVPATRRPSAVGAGPGTLLASRGRTATVPRTAEITVRAVRRAHQRLDRARAAVGVLPSLPARRAVYALCDTVAARTS
ncbi:hypothetical protein [Streptomyces sp. NPDC005930]|uniref:hypothetical protein n=1 Tax=Streptomyces sp. NPDC005930 TaxID=3364736 RepID=UPI0036A07922